jgi:hypothetical protein
MGIDVVATDAVEDMATGPPGGEGNDTTDDTAAAVAKEAA